MDEHTRELFKVLNTGSTQAKAQAIDALIKQRIRERKEYREDDGRGGLQCKTDPASQMAARIDTALANAE